MMEAAKEKESVLEEEKEDGGVEEEARGEEDLLSTHLEAEEGKQEIMKLKERIKVMEGERSVREEHRKIEIDQMKAELENIKMQEGAKENQRKELLTELQTMKEKEDDSMSKSSEVEKVEKEGYNKIS